MRDGSQRVGFDGAKRGEFRFNTHAEFIGRLTGKNATAPSAQASKPSVLPGGSEFVRKRPDDGFLQRGTAQPLNSSAWA